MEAMDVLKKEAVRVYDGMIAVFPQFHTEEKIEVSDMVPKFNGCYATNNSTVCFVSDNEVFVMPQTSLVIATLETEGFRKENLYVPFSNGDYPKSESFKWSRLQSNARIASEADFHKQCIKYCDEHHIGAINEKTLKNCFKMPSSGVTVKYHNFEDTYYPVINGKFLYGSDIERLGKFCKNNGKVVFVYRDGNTYVTKGYKIINELYNAGYIEAGLFVPFSNGEVIESQYLRDVWESIGKN